MPGIIIALVILLGGAGVYHERHVISGWFHPEADVQTVVLKKATPTPTTTPTPKATATVVQSIATAVPTTGPAEDLVIAAAASSFITSVGYLKSRRQKRRKLDIL